MLLVGSLRWALLLILLSVLLGQLSEGKGGRSGGGRGGGRSGGSRGSSAARSSSSKSSSSSSSKGSWFSSRSRGSSGARRSSSGGSWFTSTSKSKSSRTGGGFKSSSGSHSWSSDHPRPSVTSSSVSHGLLAPSRTSIYYGSTSGCGFGGCGQSYVVYHYYPQSHYYNRHTTTTTQSPIGPKSEQVITAVFSNDTLIYNEGEDASNGTEIAEIADPTRPLIIQDLAFFWDTKYLPSKDTEGCANYFPANANSTISYCNVNEYSRCQRNLKELPGFDNIFLPDGTTPSHLAWLCPASTGCCDWECCAEGEGWTVGHFFWYSILIGAVLFITVKVAWTCWMTYKEEKVFKEQRKKSEERQKLNGGVTA